MYWGRLWATRLGENAASDTSRNLRFSVLSLKTKIKTTVIANYSCKNGRNNNVLVGKPEGTRPLGRPRCRWEDNRRKWEGAVGTGWSGLRIATGGRALVSTVMNFGVPQMRGIS
jgi:hypothetical protein